MNHIQHVYADASESTPLSAHHSSSLSLCHSAQLIAKSSRRPGLRPADTDDDIGRPTGTELCKRYFRHISPAAWSYLPDSIMLTTDTVRLKKL